MANHQDAEITEIVVVLDKVFENRVQEAVELLKAAGMDVFSSDEEDNVVQGAIESIKVSSIQLIPGVNYVRSVLTYIADYPAGDPRDQDGAEDDDE
jgi:hypothetical protein